MDETPHSPDASGSQLHCDFCGESSARLRRIALDAGYERLQTPHKERYACPECSDRKEKERLGLGR
jgi:hypothetical protein